MIKSRILKSVFLLLVLCSLLASPVEAQPPPPDPRFGAVEAFRDPVAAAEARVGWERILFYWSELQPAGPEEWNSYHVPDEWLTQASAAGREVVGLLKGTPAWATDGLPGCSVPRGLDLPVDDPGNTWATFVRRVVGVYNGQINHWIIWNEPDIAPDTYGAEWCGTIEEYYLLLKIAYLAAHQVNPEVTIHLAGLTRWHDPTYLQRFLDIAAQDPTGPEHGHYFDVVSLHIYFQPETIPGIFGETYAALAAHGLQKPIWLNETNAPPNSDPLWPMEAANYEISLEEQAGFLLQSFALALSQGAERIAVYKWMDNDLQPNFEPFGIMRPDYSHRPAYDAYRLITTHYADTASAREDRQSPYTAVTLDRGNLTTRVFWARTEADVTVSVPALAAHARLIDQTGAEQVIEPADGQYTLTLPGARCADTRGCIIGGTTYLLIEENSSTPSPTETSTPIPTEPTATSPLDTPTPLPTATATPTPLPTDTPPPSPTPLPTDTPTPTPVPTPTPLPTPTPWPSAPTVPTPPAWPMLIGLAAVMLFAVLIGTLFKHQG
ncbi:MAG: hypothetical protein IMY86_10405 [Chloroflexi bacterium]|nr:hypothetical protein [Chloroflexota bacterium]